VDRIAALQRMADARTIQRQTPDGTTYTSDEIQAAYDHARTTVTKKNAKVQLFGQAMAAHLVANAGGLASNYSNPKALEKTCEGWWKRPSTFQAAVVVAPRDAMVEPTLNFDSGHGNRHFGGDPTAKKSKWSMEEGPAKTLMEAAINSHLEAIGPATAHHEDRQGWAAFYLTQHRSDPVGHYRSGSNIKATSTYTIQLQVHFADNTITYHGYPDERAENTAEGIAVGKYGERL
jgi:hypothetical protein